MDLTAERKAAAELEARILSAWAASDRSRHISEIAVAMCGDAWAFELTPLIGGGYDIQVTRRARPSLPQATLSEVAVLEPEAEGDEPRIVVALSWPWAGREPTDLPERVKAWRDEILAKGGIR